MKTFTKLSVATIVALIGLGTSGLAQNQTKLVPSGISTGESARLNLPSSKVREPQRNATSFAALPSIDNGPRDLIATELLLHRHLTADFGGVYTQEAEVYLPIFYHAGYLSLNPADQAELRTLEKDFTVLMGEYEGFLSRFSGFLERYTALHQRGHPPAGVLSETQLLVPYAGGDSRMKDNIEPIKLVRHSNRPEGVEASATTGDVNNAPTRVAPVAPKSK